MTVSKGGSIKEVEDRSLGEKSLEKHTEDGESMEETYIRAGLNPEEADFLANFGEERRKKCIRKVCHGSILL